MADFAKDFGFDSMGIDITPEYLEDRAIFRYKIRQPQGVPDEEGRFEITREDFHGLPVLKDGRTSHNWLEEFYIPQINETIIFAIDSWIETSAGESMSKLHGPYRKPRAEEHEKEAN